MGTKYEYWYIQNYLAEMQNAKSHLKVHFDQKSVCVSADSFVFGLASSLHL